MPNIADGANLDDANKVFVADAGKVFAETANQPGVWSLITQEVPIDGKSLELVLSDDLSTVRSLIPGENKVYQGTRAYSVNYKLGMKYATLKLPRLDVDYDKSGSTLMAIGNFVQQNVGFLNDVIMTEFLTQPTGYDGVALVSTAHPNGPAGATQSNKTTSALSHTTFRAGIAAMSTLRKENGQYFRFRPNLLVVHPDDEGVALEIAQAQSRVQALDNAGAETGTRVVAGTLENVFASQLQVELEPRMTTGDWWMFDLSIPGVRPWYASIPRGPEPITALAEMGAPNRVDQDIYKWSVEADVAQGPGHWQAMYGKHT